MAMKPTISDVAQRAGVSKGAVSFALNGKPGVSAQTRSRVLQAAADLGFTPSATARALAGRRSNTLGLILTRDPEMLGSDPFFPPFMAGVESVIAPIGRALTLRFVQTQQEAAAYTEVAQSKRVDGVIVADLRVDDPRPGLLADLDLPFVTLNRPDVPSVGPAVCLDDQQGIKDAVNHLVWLGHRVIAHVAGPGNYLHANSRRDEWRRMIEAAGSVATDPVEADFTAAGGARATEELLDRPAPPTAILYSNDLMAMAGLAVANRRGIAVPHDLSIVGYDDAELTAHLHPPLSTVRTDAYQWGRAAATTLIELLDGQQPADVHLPPARFVPRGSTGPARAPRQQTTHQGVSQ
jgi:DNA-binding LacI/PurR family transcriptional regulator